MSFPVIETERLILRAPVQEDFESWVEMYADAEHSRFLGGPLPRPAVWRPFLGMAGAWMIQGFSMFSVVEKATGRWVGRLGPWYPDGWPGTEVGWGLHPAFIGKGYATEGATAAIDWAFDTLGWTQVIHTIDVANHPSQKVAERLGSRKLGPCRLPAPFDHWDMEAWGQSREEWRARRR